MTNPAAASGPRELLEKMLPLLVTKDLSGFADLFAEDGVQELPFAPSGRPKRIEGREQIRAYLTAVDAPLQFSTFRPVSVYDTADPGVIIAEYDADGTVTTTGQSFTLRYLWVLEVQNGEIARFRDYWSPLALFDLLGPPTESLTG